MAQKDLALSLNHHDASLPNAHVAAPLPRHRHRNGDGGRPIAPPPPRAIIIRAATTARAPHRGSSGIFAEAATTTTAMRRIDARCAAVRDAVTATSTDAAADSAVTERRAMAMPPRLPDDATRDLLTESLKHASLATVGDVGVTTCGRPRAGGGVH